MAYSEVDLQLHDCRNRDRRRSTVLEAFNHPLHPKTNPGRSFVIFSTPEYERMEEEHTFEKGLRKPEGCDEELIANGWVELGPGDYLFSRNTLGSGNPEDDTTKAWVVGRGLQTSEDLGALDNAVELLLGAKENRTDTEVHIERLRPRVDGIKGGRCYPMANSYEKQRECMAPCANVKIGKEEGEVHKIAHDLTRATTKMAMRSMDEAPERIQTCLRDHANRLGLPCVGTDTNYAFHAIQLNLAPAKSSDSGRLGEHMGPFGDEHYDNNDCPPHYTCMVVGSQLPDNYHPGRFFLLRDGFFTRLECGSSFVFNGRNFHVGDAPHPLNSGVPEKWAYRVIVVHYPPRGMLSDDIGHFLGFLPRAIYEISPEMRRETSGGDPIHRGNHATYLREGHVIMTTKSLAQFTAQSLYLSNSFVVKQTDSKPDIKIDSKKFLEAFSFKNDEGEWEPIEDWTMAPQHPGSEANDYTRRRQEAANRMKEREREVVKHIPQCFLGLDKDDQGVPMDEDTDNESNIPAGSARVCDSPGCEPVDDDTSIARPTQASEEREPGVVSSPCASTRKRKRTDDSDESSTYEEAHSTEEVEGEEHIRSKSKRLATEQGKGKGDGSTGSKSKQRDKGRGKGDGKGKGKEGTSVTEDRAGISTGGRQSPVAGEQDQSSSIGKGPGRENAVDREHTPSSNTRCTKTGQSPAASYTFIRHCSIEDLEVEVYHARKETIVTQVTDTELSYTPCPNLEEVLDRLKTRSCSSKTLDDVNQVQTSARAAEHSINKDERLLRARKLALIRAESAVWEWVDKTLREKVRSTVEGSPADEEWIDRTVEATTNMFVQRKKEVLFKASEMGFLGQCTEDEVVLCNSESSKMFLPGGQDIVGAVEEAVLNVVVQWMGLPTRRRQRGWFVTIVADVLGPEALTLDWGWSMYTDFRPWYLVKSNKVYKARTLRRSDASGFEQALRSHPITKADTIEGRLYRTYRGLLDGSLSPSNTMTPISVDPTAWGRLCTMLERCLVYVQDRPSITNEGFQGKLIDDADYYLAFREHAPSRVQTRSTIFHSSTIRTNVGIFSAVVWRGITYRTPFATNHRQVFKSYNDFIDTIRSVVNDDLTTPTTEDDSYFCRGDAYGSRNPNRSIQNASAYWKTITKRHWPRMAASNPTFQECWQWFRPAKQKDHDRLFPQLGDLGSYLLTADLAYANVCQFPTVDELASAIVELNKGAMNGLKRLGFIRGRERSKKDKVAVVSEALRSLDALIRESFGKDDLNEAGYDLICLEHILCKFQRTYKLRDM